MDDSKQITVGFDDETKKRFQNLKNIETKLNQISTLFNETVELFNQVLPSDKATELHEQTWLLFKNYFSLTVFAFDLFSFHIF